MATLPLLPPSVAGLTSAWPETSRHNKAGAPGQCPLLVHPILGGSMGGCCGEDIPVLGKHSIGQFTDMYYKRCMTMFGMKSTVSILLVKIAFHTQKSTLTLVYKQAIVSEPEIGKDHW